MSLRAELVQTCLAMLRSGLAVATTGNASVRDGDAVLISPTSLPYEEMEPADVVRIDLDGRVAGGDREASSEWRVHCAIYRARPEVGAIVHTHSPHAVAWSFLGDVLDTGTEEIEHYAGGPVRTAPFAPTGGGELAAAALAALGDRRAVLMARHGVVGCGATLRAALDTCAVVEQQAQVAWLLRGSGTT
ncbi:MAG: class II aldolase/adducin family protein [Thermoleophilaceae bacterium]